MVLPERATSSLDEKPLLEKELIRALKLEVGAGKFELAELKLAVVESLLPNCTIQNKNLVQLYKVSLRTKTGRGVTYETNGAGSGMNSGQTQCLRTKVNIDWTKVDLCKRHTE
ncbi:hypothetical protein JHK86_052790 [Glycine max]|nr:hypothetical protein JHK86_052790 [Glycine max]